MVRIAAGVPVDEPPWLPTARILARMCCPALNPNTV
jgi:hypothetical protein